MYRRFFAVVIASMLLVGGLFAEEFRGIFIKFDGTATIEVDGKEMTYKISDRNVKTRKGEVPLSDLVKKLKVGDEVWFHQGDGSVIVRIGKIRK